MSSKWATERADKLLREQPTDLGLPIVNLIEGSRYWIDSRDWVASALDAARAEAFEEAAKVAEDAEIIEAKGDTYYGQSGDARATAAAIAAAIRAKAKEQ